MTADATTCVSCGRAPSADEQVQLCWSRGVERGRTVWTCPQCSRRHLRAIEGKLDSEWW